MDNYTPPASNVRTHTDYTASAAFAVCAPTGCDRKKKHYGKNKHEALIERFFVFKVVLFHNHSLLLITPYCKVIEEKGQECKETEKFKL